MPWWPYSGDGHPSLHRPRQLRHHRHPGDRLGLQTSTTRHFAFPDFTTTVLSLTLTEIAADSTVVGGTGSKPHRRVRSIVAMLAGATIGALLQQVSASAGIVIAAALAGGVAIVFVRGQTDANIAAPAPAGA